MKYAEAEQRWAACRGNMPVVELNLELFECRRTVSSREDMEAQLALADADTRWRDARKKDWS